LIQIEIAAFFFSACPRHQRLGKQQKAGRDKDQEAFSHISIMVPGRETINVSRKMRF
jgi:hypothetical protein